MPFRRPLLAILSLFGLVAGLITLPSTVGSVSAAINCGSYSPMSLTYDTTGLSTPTITVPLGALDASPGVTIDWGDGTTGTFTTNGNKAHTFPAPGVYTVLICGSLQYFGSGNGAVPNAQTLVSINSFGTLPLLFSLQNAFYASTNLVDVPATLPPTVSVMKAAFSGAKTLNDPDISQWDTSRVVDMTSMFSGAIAFNRSLSNWSTASVASTSNMFSNATAFNNGCTTGDYSCPLTWTTPQLTDPTSMFSGATKFNQNVNTWDVSKVVNFDNLFKGASSFNNGCSPSVTTCPLSWTVGAAARSLATMFQTATSFNQNVTALLSVPNGVTSVLGMFSSASVFNNGDDVPAVNAWHTGSVRNFAEMFRGGTTFNRHVERWDMSAAVALQYMFSGADAFNNGCAKGDATCPLTWTDTSKVTRIDYIFAGVSVIPRNSFDQNVNSWDISSITDFSSAFGPGVFNNAGEPLWSGSTVKAGATMKSMFWYNAKFNVPVSGIDVTGAINMGSMFSNSPTFNQDISTWNVGNLNSVATAFGSSMQNFLTSGGLSVENYEKFLNSLGTVSGGVLTLTHPGMNTWTSSWYMNMGSSNYTCNTADLRSKLAAKFTLTDGGTAPLPAPTINSVTPGDTTLVVAYSPPVCLGVRQSPASYQYSIDNGVTWVSFAVPSPATADGTLRLTGLTNGVTYPIRIRALTALAGVGAPSAAVDGTPSGPVTVDPVITVASKSYDGTTRATITACALRVRNSNPVRYITDATLVSCDVSAATASFGSANAGASVSVTAAGASLTGPRAADYILGTTSGNAAAITPAPLKVSPDPITVQEGTDPGSVSYPYVVEGWVNGDTASTSFSPVAFVPPTCSAASYTSSSTVADSPLTITCTGGTAPSNYTLDTSGTASMTILAGPPPVLVVATISASNKVYDGTRDADITCSLTGVDPVDVESVSCDLTGASALFDSKNVGEAKTVTATGLALSNSSSTNYQLTATTRTALASITPKSVTPSITADDKQYDKSTAATILTCSLSGVVAADTTVTCDFSGSVAVFADANAGTVKTVTATGLAVANNSAGNYIATTDGASTTAAITKRPVTYGALVDTKVYDSTTSSDVVPLSGLLGGESSNATQSFDSADAGTRSLLVDIACAAVTITDDGVDVTSNYDITCDATPASGAISKASVKIAPVSDSKDYDGTTDSSGVPDVVGLFGSDAIAATQRFDASAAGTRTLEVAGYQFTVGNTDNYEVDDSATVSGTISAIGPVRVKAPSIQYMFDGSSPTLTPIVTGLLGEDDFVTQPVCRVYATTDLTFAAPITDFASIIPNSYTVHCSGADAGTNYTEVVYDDAVLLPAGTATFTGRGLVFTKTNSASATLSATVEPATEGCFASFSLLDLNDNVMYTFGPFNAATGAVATTQLVATGSYTVRITAFGNCYGRTDDLLSVVHDSVGRGSVGGGFYRNGVTPSKINFGYEVQTTSTTKGNVTTTTTKGQLLWIAKVGWRVKGSIRYSSTDGSTKWTRIACPSMSTSIWPAITRPLCGQVQGTGSLQSWNSSTLEWETHDANISFTATVYDGSKVTTCKSKSACTTTQYPDFFGMTIWASDGSQILPNTVSPPIPVSDPVRLANGEIRVFLA